MKKIVGKKPKAPEPLPSAPRPVVSDPGGVDRSRRSSAARELSWADFDVLVQQMARGALKAFKPDAVVGVAHGGVFVGGALASALQREFYPVRISRRSRDSGSRAGPKMTGTMPKELKGKRVLIVDDIASSGDTLELAAQLAKGVGAKAVATASLVSRPNGFEPDFTALREDTFFVFPWDYASVVEDVRFDVDPDTAGA